MGSRGFARFLVLGFFGTLLLAFRVILSLVLLYYILACTIPNMNNSTTLQELSENQNQACTASAVRMGAQRY